MGKLYKDYHLIGDRLYKFNVKEERHLLKNFGGVPAIDAGLWEKYKGKLSGITIKTNHARTFKVDTVTFDNNKIEINYGFGPQYVLPLNKWKITSKQAPLKLSPFPY